MPVLQGGEIFTNGKAYVLLVDMMGRLFEPIRQKLAAYEDYDKLLQDVDLVSESEVRKEHPDSSAGEGHTYRYFDDGHIWVDSVEVVVYDEFLDPNKADEPADFDHFVDVMFTVFHEARHAEQVVLFSREDTEFGNLMFLANMAEQASKYYQDDIYFVNPAEIDAQHFALRRGYAFLSSPNGFDGIIPEECVLSYQERRNRNLDKDYIPRPGGGRYESVEAIFEAYENSFLESVHSYKPRGVEGLLFGNEVMDRFLRTHRGAYMQFCTEKDGYKQLEMAAAAYIDGCYDGLGLERADRIRRIMLGRFKEDRGLDLSVDATFGKRWTGHIGSRAPKPGEYGDKALTCFSSVMQQVEEQGLLTLHGKEDDQTFANPLL